MKYNILLTIICSSIVIGCTTIGQQIINRDGVVQIKQENVDLEAQSGSNPPHTATPVTFVEKENFIIDERKPEWRVKLDQEFEIRQNVYTLTPREQKVAETGIDIIPSKEVVNTNATNVYKIITNRITVYTNSINITN
jgi:hypothetical protein